MKLFPFLSLSLLTLLLFLAFFMRTISNPLDQQYTSLVQEMANQEGGLEETLLLDQHPDLKELQKQIATIKQTKQAIRNATAHPIPPVESESERLRLSTQQLKTMEAEVVAQITRLNQQLQQNP